MEPIGEHHLVAQVNRLQADRLIPLIGYPLALLAVINVEQAGAWHTAHTTVSTTAHLLDPDLAVLQLHSLPDFISSSVDSLLSRSRHLTFIDLLRGVSLVHREVRELRMRLILTLRRVQPPQRLPLLHTVVTLLSLPTTTILILHVHELSCKLL